MIGKASRPNICCRCKKSQCCRRSLKAVCWSTLSSRKEVSLLCYSGFEWLEKPTHIMESNLLYSKSTNLNLYCIQISPMKTSRIMTHNYNDVWTKYGLYGPPKLTHKISHCSQYCILYLCFSVKCLPKQTLNTWYLKRHIEAVKLYWRKIYLSQYLPNNDHVL